MTCKHEESRHFFWPFWVLPDLHKYFGGACSKTTQSGQFKHDISGCNSFVNFPLSDCSHLNSSLSESFQPGSSLFREHYPYARPSLNEGQEGGGREKRPNISKTHFQSNDIRLFSSCSATKNSLSHLNNSKKRKTQNKGTLKHAKKPLRKKNPKGQEVTGSEVKRRGPGRPRKNPAPCFFPTLLATPLHHEVTECPAKRKKGERDDYTVLNAIEAMAQHKKRQRRKKRHEDRSIEGQVDEGKDGTLSQEPFHSHTDTASPTQDPSVSVNNQSEKRSAVPHEKKYECAGLYSNVYKSDK